MSLNMTLLTSLVLLLMLSLRCVCNGLRRCAIVCAAVRLSLQVCVATCQRLGRSAMANIKKTDAMAAPRHMSIQVRVIAARIICSSARVCLHVCVRVPGAGARYVFGNV